MLNFKDEKERQTWLVLHAEYFTVIEARLRDRQRHEVKTLLEAEDLAHELCLEQRGSRWMIYAVKWPHETFVKVVAA